MDYEEIKKSTNDLLDNIENVTADHIFEAFFNSNDLPVAKDAAFVIKDMGAKGRYKRRFLFAFETNGYDVKVWYYYTKIKSQFPNFLYPDIKKLTHE